VYSCRCIVVAELKGARYPFICVSKDSEKKYKAGEMWSIMEYKQAKPISTITIEEAEKKLGCKIKR
jgi:hypothetical protein